ncbi:MAG: hypothetical protein LUF28_04550 [Clostridiales bacterium]|nr:hypothetical protein [Clostridiales bacterium]
MAYTRQEALETLLRSYSVWYDVTRCNEEDAPMVAQAAFHEQGTAYLLFKRAKMWGANRNEYVFLFSVPHLTEDVALACIAQAQGLGDELIVPDREHMCSYIVAEILCDTADEAAVQAVRRYHRRKSFQFSLQGWTETHAALVELGKDSIVTNPDGRLTAKFLKSALYPKPKKRDPVRKLSKKQGV